MRLALSRAVMAASLACAAGASGCTSTKSDLGPVGVSDKPGSSLADRATTYAFDALDDRAVSSAAHRGKPAILCFVTTGDIVGQAQVDYLVAMEKNDGKRVSYALVALHPRKEIVLVEAYVAALKVTFPVALGPPPVMGNDGPFGEISAVPTIVVLDAEGKISWKHTGLARPDEIRGHLRTR